MLQQRSSKCPVFSSVWLIAINFLFFVIGIALIGASAWGITQQKEDVVTSALPAGGLNTFVAVGVFLMLTSILGWVGVGCKIKLGGRVVLGFYATVLIILMIMEFAAAGAVIAFTGKLDEFGPAQAVKENGIYRLINQSYADCCCAHIRCPNDTCWLPANLLYPCDSLDNFRLFLTDYIDERLIPISVVAILIGIVQFFTAITACCNQCSGFKDAEKREMVRQAAQVPYDGLYNEDGESGYGAYVTQGQVRPGSAAAAGSAGATAPKAPAAGRGAVPAKK